MSVFEKTTRQIIERLTKVADDERDGLCHLSEAELSEQRQLIDDYLRWAVDRTNGNVKE
jgi:hypothetical protein